MRTEPVRAAILSLATLLACCRGQPAPAPSTVAASPAACRVGPDGGPDRAAMVADRGIGGTGSPVVLADRGIGGTGIIGVITGFGSVCLAGQEVALPSDVSVSIDQLPASPDILRAGQVAIVDAAGDPAGLRARRIVIRYEVVGAVDRVDDAMVRIAGQDVALSPQTWGPRPGRGDWVAVSGLRRGDGVIEATRIEPTPRGPVLVHGLLIEEAGGLRIGALPVRRDPPTVSLIGHEVTVTGMIGQNGKLLPFSMTPDLLLIDPAAYFGPQVGIVLIEGFAVVDGGRLRLAPGFSAPAPNFRLERPQRGVFRFERVDGGLRATGFGLRPIGVVAPMQTSQPRFEPAPIPNRAVRGVTADRPGFRGGRGDGPRGRFGRDRSDGGTAGPGSFGPSGFGPPGEAGPRGR